MDSGVVDAVRAWCARRLERGLFVPPAIARPLSSVYGGLAARHLARPTKLPDNAAVIGIGGAVLGGAGKTPVAIAYAQAWAQAGVRTALVSHAFGARPSRPRRVCLQDAVSEVGDDALVSAAALRDSSVQVWVGPCRDETLAAASREADMLVVDGLLQTRPARLAWSVLVLDARSPFGSGVMPPAGDLRAPAQSLLAACDEVVLVDDPVQFPHPAPVLSGGDGLPGRRVRRAWLDASVAFTPFGLACPCLGTARLGLLLTIARPERVANALCARHIVPVCCWFGADHRALRRADQDKIRALAIQYRLDGWLTSPKCATHLDGLDLAAPVAVVQVSTRLDPSPRPVVGSRACARPNSY